MPVHDQLLGLTQPVLSISLEPGESVIAETAAFAWMTDSIQMAAGPAGQSAYTAKGTPGTIAFASRLPGTITSLEVGPDREYLVHRQGFVAGTPGIEVTTCFRQPFRPASREAGEFVLLRVSGSGRAWIGLSGDVVRRDLVAGSSLRTLPSHVGICEASVAVQMAELGHLTPRSAGARHFAVLSGPGSVWLQSMPVASQVRPLTASSAARGDPAVEGAAGPPLDRGLPENSEVVGT
jgi:uncharacterized protein (AIM24 family)